MNNVNLSGRLAKDVDVRSVKVSDKDRQVASATIVVNNRFSGKSEFYRVDAWDNNATALSHLKKGDYVVLNGSLRTSDKGDSITVKTVSYTQGGNQYGLADAFILGNLTKDAKYVQGKEENGKKSADGLFFTIANNVSKDVVYYIDIQVFGPMATSLSKLLTKGKQVLVKGELNAYVSEYEGNKRNRIRVNSVALQVLSAKKDEAPAETAADQPAPEDAPQIDVDDDDLPF